MCWFHKVLVSPALTTGFSMPMKSSFKRKIPVSQCCLVGGTSPFDITAHALLSFDQSGKSFHLCLSITSSWFLYRWKTLVSLGKSSLIINQPVDWIFSDWTLSVLAFFTVDQTARGNLPSSVGLKTYCFDVFTLEPGINECFILSLFSCSYT